MNRKENTPTGPARAQATRVRIRVLPMLAALCLFANAAEAQTQAPPTPQFAFTGFMQEATLDTTGAICTPGTDPATGLPAARLRGGTMTVNGVKMIVPCNSIVQMSAATFTWADLFDPANAAAVGTTNVGSALPVQGAGQTRLALADNPMPFPSFAVSATGNVVGKNPDGTDRYIVAYITPIEQQVLNGGSGIITYIDYAFGSFRVGGNGATGCNTTLPGGGPSCTGSLLQFNDPAGRWGLPHSIDPRWSGDNENTTIHASTGIPVCIPRVAPPAIDAECPLTNRPLNGDSRFPVDPFLAAGAPLKNFTMPAPVLKLDPLTGLPLSPPVNTLTPDAYKQVPMMVGDQVNWIGTVFKLDPLRTVTLSDGSIVPDNTPANTYMSVHTVEDVLGIFTQPGVPPAYVTIEGFLIGSGGAAVQGILQEASTRVTVVGFTTDPTRLVDIYAQDINPCTGQETLRLLATTDPATQPLVGRFVHRVLGGDFMPPTRYYVMKSRTQFRDAAGQPVDTLVANGIVAGQYLLPNFEFVIPENHRLGDPIIPGNFQDFPFLAQGSGPLEGFGTNSPVVGQLTPWPGAVTPTPVNCAAFGAFPVTNAGLDVAVRAGTLVTLSGTVTWDANDTALSRAVQWTQGGTPVITLSANVDATHSTVSTTFTAPATATTLAFTLTATDNFGATSDTVNVTVLPATDTVQVGAATFVIQRGPRGNFGKLTVTATTNDPTAILSLSQRSVDGAVTNWGTGASTPANPTTFDWVEIKGATQPASLTVTSTKGGSATVICGAANANGAVTCP